MNPAIHHIATAGNAAALVLLALVLANDAALFRPRAGSTQAHAITLPVASARADRAVLIVIDGLRADVAADPRIMPRLCDIARRGGHGTARVECLVPSTVAGVTTLVTGVVPPPASFLEDFAARPAAEGGLFADVSTAGGQSFVAGPALWTQRFGRWISAWQISADLEGQDDDALLRGGMEAMREDGYRLIVFHFSRADAAEHRFGAASPEYAAAAGWCDAAVARIAAATGPRDALLVTSDHGAADAGGHGGPEPDVLNAPLVTLGASLPSGALPSMRQRELPDLLRRTLGLRSASTSRTLPASASVAPPAPSIYVAILAILTAIAAIPLLASAAGSASKVLPFALNLTLWTALALCAMSWRGVALALVFAVLLIAAARVNRRGPSGTTGLAMLAGLALGALRLLDSHAAIAGPVAQTGATIAYAALPMLLAALGSIGEPFGAMAPIQRKAWAAADGVFPKNGRMVASLVACLVFVLGWVAGGARLALACAAALVGGGAAARVVIRSLTDESRIALRSKVALIALGAASGFVQVLLGRALGETLSLSTLDVRHAYAAAEGTGGIAAAVGLVFVAQALPPLSLWFGARALLRRLDAQSLGALAAGLGAVHIGQALPCAIVLAHDAASQEMRMLALGGLLRGAAEATLAFLALAALIVAIPMVVSGSSVVTNRT